MGFWEITKRMIQGKPAFVDPEGSTSQVGPQPDSGRKAQVEEESGRKVIPQVKIDNCKSRISGDAMLVTAWMTNMSDSPVELEKISLLGQTFRLDRQLQGHGAREVKLYEGPLALDDNQKKSELYYQHVATNDYFCADFVVEYKLESDGRFSIGQFHPEKYVRDI